MIHSGRGATQCELPTVSFEVLQVNYKCDIDDAGQPKLNTLSVKVRVTYTNDDTWMVDGSWTGG